ncbi:hypothetical protein BU24DRAFT_423470, partial [Aaosphaeria arxii CBS 175.79]
MAELSVIIYLDASIHAVPHWCLYTKGDYGEERIFEALGITGQEFNFNTSYVDMANCDIEKQIIHVGRIEADVWDEVPSILAEVPVSSQMGWNCQSWVMSAIEKLLKI